MDKLTFELNKMSNVNRDGSYTTQRDRQKLLRLFAKQLREMGFKNMSVRSLKTKHVTRLIDKWSTEKSIQSSRPVSAGTIKNRLAVLRWWSQKINKQNIIPKDNKTLGIEDRQRISSINKAFYLSKERLVPLPTYLKYSLRLQQEFGLRREESAKFIAQKAINENHIKLCSSWTKGGRERLVPITNQIQRELLNEINNYSPNSSLIPNQMSYREYISHRDYHLYRHEIINTHGLRYDYAQRRYTILTNGLIAPKLGGKTYKQMSENERVLDQSARLQISSELGHSRVEITKIYLG